MSSARPGPVVAGFSGTPGSRQALRWACREAAVRRRELHLVRAFSTPLEELTRIHFPAEPVDFGLLHADVEHEVSGTVAECARDWPELTITGESRLGHPALVLREAAEDGDLLVLGPAQHGRLHHCLLGSTSDELLRGSAVPVVFVRGTEWVERHRVVVGVDGSRISARAVGFAFDHAARHGAELVAALAWDELPRDAIAPARWSLDWTDVTRGCERQLAESLAGWQEQYPDVPVRHEVTTTELPAELLLRHAREAGLVVVGRHGRFLMHAAMVGSTGRAVAHRAPCPVAVVP
ncbi:MULTISPECIES: universal stress protein [unclassified Saccharopolyspora]|uniref:universal stress protein n=1 Tax=unclassified Saccharopolyspora TaxID=2646250 RepID=UPI001CD1FBB1|nr:MULTISPECIES: universal stress protein [unclassified Saccharopolyspora]MCA1189930.1 universal stress protein [Saccharopolyspora sp. 6T]MCA1226281.1 universal stress protein [Saccharopolyspora sp. 6M]MCA1278248.1 universal stress protein [Saccharopolyspora sp. 7B]